MMASIGVISYQNCSLGKFESSSADESSVHGDCVSTGGTLICDEFPPASNLIENADASVWPDGAIEGIQPAQIFQRQDNGKASITLTLKQAVPANLVSYSVVSLTSANTREAILNSGALNGKTSFKFEFATGMASRKVRFSLYDGNGLEQIRWTSPGFSVGEVFLVSGQSNSTTHGLGASTSKSILNRGVDPLNKTWVPMADPLPYGSNFSMPPWNNPSFNGGSPWPAFADELSTQLQVPVAIILVGWGGSAVSWWLPGYKDDYFSRLLIGARAVPSCGFRAVLWHQGESDAMGKTSASVYQSTLQNVVSAFRSSTGCQQPWMIARATHNGAQYWMQNYQLSLADAEAAKWASEVEIRKAQNAVAQSPTFLTGPDTDLMVALKYRYDDLHFSADGLALHGKLWAQRVLGLLKSPMQIEKDLVPEVKTVWSAMQTNLPRTDSEMAADGEGVRYWTKALSTGKVTADEMAKTFRDSDEAFIRKVYADGFARQPSASELNNWIAQIQSGAMSSRDQLKAAILKTK